MGYFVPGPSFTTFHYRRVRPGFMESPETFMLIWLTFWSAGSLFF